MTGLIAGRLRAMLPGAFGAAALYGVLIPLRLWALRRARLESGPAREAVLLAFVLFCGGLADLVLTPPSFHWSGIFQYLRDPGLFFSPGRVVGRPFQTWIGLDPSDPRSVLYQVGNVVLFLPFGLFPPLLWRRYGWRRALLVGICVTLGIESWQLLVGRTFDVDDLILNTAGASLGWILWRAADAASHGRARLWCAERGGGDGGDP